MGHLQAFIDTNAFTIINGKVSLLQMANYGELKNYTACSRE